MIEKTPLATTTATAINSSPPPPGEAANHTTTTTTAATSDDHGDDHQTVISDVTFESNSLFSGPLYPITSSDLVPIALMEEEGEVGEDEGKWEEEKCEVSPPPPAISSNGQEPNPPPPLFFSSFSSSSQKPGVTTTAAAAAAAAAPAADTLKDQEDTILKSNKITYSNKSSNDGDKKKDSGNKVISSTVDQHNIKSKKEMGRILEKEQCLIRKHGVVPEAAARTTTNNNDDDVEAGGCAEMNRFLQETEPMPLPSSPVQRQPHISIPGAHRVAGPQYPMMQAQAQRNSSSSNNNNVVIDEEGNRCVDDDDDDDENDEINSVTYSSSMNGAFTASSSSICAFTFESKEFKEGDQEDDFGDLIIVGEILHDKNNIQGTTTQNLSRRKLVLLVLFLVVVVTGLCLAVVFAWPSSSSSASLSSTGDGTEDNGGNPFLPPTQVQPVVDATGIVLQKIETPFQDNLPTAVLKEIQNIKSPFYSANVWMLQDPLLGTYSLKRQRQRFFLALTYVATNGENWIRNDHWMSYNISECSWYSHTSIPESSPYYIPSVCNENGDMISFSLANNNLTGTLPLFTTDLWLPDLLFFDIGDNHIGGEFPLLEGRIPLETWIIKNNNFEGAIKGNLDVPNIRMIISGGNPFNFGNNNRRDGQPTQGQIAFMHLLCNSMEYWERVNHYYVGGLPSELGLCTKLWHFTSNNQLSGTIPSEVGKLSLLQELELSNNSALAGTLPTQLGRLTALTYLGIAGTAVYGSIPEQLCERADAGLLDIHANCSNVECCI